MFYSQFILAKKGPLGTIWIAAHLERKLRKNQVADTDIGVSVDSIIFPEVPIALRLSSHLLLGVVRIYSRKVNYLFDDCSETLLKIKQAFRSAAVDLPPEESKAPYHSITLPETFDLDDFELPDTDIFQGNYVDHHVSAKEQITLQDTMEGIVFSTSQFGLDERFGDGETCQIGLDLNEDALFEKNAATGSTANKETFDADPQASVYPMTPLDADDDNNDEMTESSKLLLDNDGPQQVEVLERNSEPTTDFAEAPSTPMLVEEANLSSVQDALASDEHGESEVIPNLAEPFSEEDGRHIPRTDVVDDNHLSGEMTIRQKDELLQSAAADCIAHVSVNGVNSVPLSSSLDHNNDLEKPMLSLSHSADGLMEDLGCAEEDNNAAVRTEESSSCIGGQTHAKSSAQLLAANSDGFLEREKSDPTEVVTETVEKSFPLEKASADCQFESLDSPGFYNSEMDMPKEDQEREGQSNNFISGLRACSSKVRHQEEDTSFAEVEKEYAAVDELGFDGNQMSKQTDSGERSQARRDSSLNDQPVDKCDMNLDLDAPEKLLSVPDEPAADKPNILLTESTPNKEYLQEGGMINTLTESAVPMQSNLLESSGLIQSKRTMGSIPDDDDLLSSILVGRRSSVLKMKPSPVPLALTPAKRVRTASRASSSKRKVLMDETMVLHGDVIRQQLINTEDLRRARKKAPCTLTEISILRRQFLEDEIFSESTHPGLSRELSYMQKGVYDLSRLKICEFDEAISPIGAATKISDEPNLSKETDKEENEVPLSIRDGDEVRAAEIPIIENHQDTIQFEVETLQPESNDRIDAMEIDEETVAGVEPMNDSAVSGFDVHLPFDSVVKDTSCISVNTDSNIADKEGDAVEVNASPFDIALKPECFEENSPIVELITEKELNALAEPCVNADVTQSEPPSADFDLLNELDNGAALDDDMKTDTLTDDCLMTSHDVEVSAAVTVLERGDGCSNSMMIVEESGEAADTIRISSISAVHEVESQNLQLEHVEAAVTGNCSESTAADFVHQFEHESGIGCSSLPNEEMAGVHDSHRIRDLKTTNDLDDLENVMFGNDTEFLNVDDDEVDDDNEHDVPDGQESKVLDNSGWSSRTRAVAKYLQMSFEKEEAVRGRSVLAMDSLLVGKTRKEASRMFFESLVLKTKDYIHVEQEKPFDKIAMRPRGKLMKSVF